MIVIMVIIILIIIKFIIITVITVFSTQLTVNYLKIILKDFITLNNFNFFISFIVLKYH